MILNITLVFAFLALCCFAGIVFLKRTKAHFEEMMNSSTGQMVMNRSRKDILRKKIVKSQCVEEQKKLAYAAFQTPFNAGGIQSVSHGVTLKTPDKMVQKSSLKLNDLGSIVGIICSGFFVLKDTQDNLQVICSNCVRQAIDETYSSVELPLHQQGEFMVGGLSVKDYVLLKLQDISKFEGSRLCTDFLAFQGKIPSCEMPCCKH